MIRFIAGTCCALIFVSSARADFVTFEDLTLAPESFWRGPDPNGHEIIGKFGPEVEGSFTSNGAEFINRFNTTFGSWSGFAYSNTSDTTTPGYLNQFSAFTGSGRGGSGNYGVAFGYDDIEPNLFDDDPFDPTDLADLNNLPHFIIPTGSTIAGAYVTNTTYAALSMMLADSFAKRFGGDSGNDPDWFKISAYGIDSKGVLHTTDFYLADFRFSDNSLDYIVSDWKFFDLTPLGDAQTLYFNMSSSDAGLFGLNTPAYFAIDDILVERTSAVPEPSSLALLLTGCATIGCVRYRRCRAT